MKYTSDYVETYVNKCKKTATFSDLKFYFFSIGN